jgi:hypothetical protein
MRQVTLGLIAVLGLLAMTDSASAKDRSRKMRYQQPQQNYYYQEQERPGLFSGLMELERRKNAWLMRTFFGR